MSFLMNVLASVIGIMIGFAPMFVYLWWRARGMEKRVANVEWQLTATTQARKWVRLGRPS